MNIIDEYYSNVNIYFSLLVYQYEVPYDLIGELKEGDYPVVIVHDLNELEYYEINHRMFVLSVDLLPQLLFMKQNCMEQYSAIFCLDDTFDYMIDLIEKKKPSCVENILITNI